MAARATGAMSLYKFYKLNMLGNLGMIVAPAAVLVSFRAGWSGMS